MLLEKPIIPNQPNQSSKMSQHVVDNNEDAVWVGTKMITIGLDLRALRMLLFLYM
jgi:aconitase B